MIVTLGYWTVLFCSFFGVGWYGRRMARAVWDRKVIESLDEILMAGVVLCAIYAETVSIFFPLGVWPLAILVLIATVSVLVWHREIVLFWRDRLCRARGRLMVRIGGLVGFVSLAALWTCFDLCDFDNLNYHAQSIRWLEDYGIVKGLGNLHTRLAYNSAFFPLQALFSFAWAGKMSLHSLNGFLWVFAMCFCCFGRGKGHLESIRLSDCFRFLLFLVAARRGLVGATPSADFLPLFLTGYVFIKWCENNEREKNCRELQLLLSLLCVFCVSVKLSAAMLACFCLHPFCNMVADRNWRGLAGFILGCVAVSAPFLARNILLSGWLIYPFPWLDLFAVDWKIPSLVAISDAAAIRAYALFGEAWNWRYCYLHHTPIFWFTQWFSENTFWERIAVGVDAVFFPLCCFLYLIRTRKKTTKRYDGVVFGTAFAGFMYLMLTAPSLRFGIWWVFSGLVMTCWMLSDWITYHFSRKKRTHLLPLLTRAVYVAYVVYALVVFVKLNGVAWRREGGVRSHVLWPADYADVGSTVAWLDLGGQRFYYREATPDGPREGGMNGYHGFPGTEYRSTLDLIEMRGTDLADGFRRRTNSQLGCHDFRGRELGSEELNALGWRP